MQKTLVPRCIQVIFRNSQAAIFSFSITSFKSSLPHPSPLKPKAQEIFLVEQFGLELCQSVTWLTPQPFFIVGDSLYCTITAAQHPVAWTGSPVMLNTGPQWTTWHTSSFEINVNVVCSQFAICSQSTNRFLSFKFFFKDVEQQGYFPSLLLDFTRNQRDSLPFCLPGLAVGLTFHEVISGYCFCIGYCLLLLHNTFSWRKEREEKKISRQSFRCLSINKKNHKSKESGSSSQSVQYIFCIRWRFFRKPYDPAWIKINFLKLLFKFRMQLTTLPLDSVDQDQASKELHYTAITKSTEY